jgi:hypothetical protein
MCKLGLFSVAAIVAGLVVGMSALSLQRGDAEANAQTPEATVAAGVEAWNDGDAEAFISYFTADGLEQVVGIEPTVAAVEADMDETGPIAGFEVSEVKVVGGGFTAIVDIQFEAGFSLYERWTFENTANGLVISASEPASRPIPPGVPAVDLTVQEYAFVYNEAAINAADGNFAFSVTNKGQEEHEVVILSLDSDKPLIDLLQDSDPESEDLPQGVDFVAFGGFFPPGSGGNVVLPGPLAPGKYGLVCFVPSPDGIPHAFLGMVSEFSVSGGGPVDAPAGGITPPNTGDGGLLDGGTPGMTWLLMVIATVLVLGGGAGLVASRVRSGA